MYSFILLRGAYKNKLLFRLMTDYYEAFLKFSSNFPGQIQSTIIDACSKSVLTCLFNNDKNLK